MKNAVTYYVERERSEFLKKASSEVFQESTSLHHPRVDMILKILTVDLM